MEFISLYEKFKSREVHKLSGVIILIEDRILLVSPKKFKGQKNKWSIPKGHVEGNVLKSALHELREETGIKIHKNFESKLKAKYRKNGVDKKLTAYLYRLNKEDIQKYLKGWDIKKSRFDRDEIYEAKFFKLDKAYNKIEDQQRVLIDELTTHLEESN